MVYLKKSGLILLMFISGCIFSNLAVAEVISQYAWVKVRVQKNPEKIETVSLNDYLAGVVSKEMPLSWPAEALKAQAVVARSYLFSKMDERYFKKFHVEADQMDQVYAQTTSSKAYEAVQSTDGLVLSLQGKIVRSYYHSDCGGHTLPAYKVWPGAIDTGTARDQACAQRNKNQWQHSISVAHFQDKKSYQAQTYKDKIVAFDSWGIQKLRQFFGFAKIRSAPDAIEVHGEEIIFTGRGFGHGVGLCQWGSKVMAEKGRSYFDILTHYYPKAQIQRIQSLEIKNYFTKNQNPMTINN